MDEPFTWQEATDDATSWATLLLLNKETDQKPLLDSVPVHSGMHVGGL